MNYSAEYVRDLELQNAMLMKLLKRANKKVDDQLEEIDMSNCIKDYIEKQLKEILECRIHNCCKSVHACDDLHAECGWCECCDEYKQKQDRLISELIAPQPEDIVSNLSASSVDLDDLKPIKIEPESDDEEPEPVKPVKKSEKKAFK